MIHTIRIFTDRRVSLRTVLALMLSILKSVVEDDMQDLWITKHGQLLPKDLVMPSGPGHFSGFTVLFSIVVLILSATGPILCRNTPANTTV